MAVTLFKYKEDRITYVQVEGELSQDDIAMMTRQLTENREANVMYHNIINLLEMDSMPLSVGETIKNMRQHYPKSNNPGWSLVVSRQNSIVHMLTSIITQAFGIKARMFRSIEEGLEFLQAQDDYLPPLLPFDPALLYPVLDDEVRETVG